MHYVHEQNIVDTDLDNLWRLDDLVGVEIMLLLPCLIATLISRMVLIVIVLVVHVAAIRDIVSRDWL